VCDQPRDQFSTAELDRPTRRSAWRHARGVRLGPGPASAPYTATVPPEPDPRVEITLAMAQGQLAAQMSAVDELRSRVGTLIGAGSIATGFLAGQALNTTHGVPAGAWLGMGAAFALILACAWILKPREWAGQAVDTTIMLEDIRNWPDESIDDFRRRMTGYARREFTTNRPRLERLYWVLSVALGFLCLDFAGWLWVLIDH
jgi:hypothetical protein